MLRKLTLAQSIIGFSFFALLAMGWGAMTYSEKLVEEVMLDQAKRQAKMFLQGIALEIKARDALSHPERLTTILSKSHQMMESELIFSVERVYLYNREGVITADSLGESGRKIDMSGVHGEVIRTRESYLGGEVEYVPENGIVVPKTDIIIPMREKGVVIGGLEAEIDLLETMAHIQMLDDKYERYILMVFSIGGLLFFFFIWWVVNRILIRPINSLLTVTNAVSNGDLEQRADKGSCYELDHLGAAVNTMTDSIKQLMEEQEQAYLQALQALAKALETKDGYTARHSGRVAKYSVKLGRRIGLDDHQLTLLKQGALMHDLGKIGIPDSVLNKPGALTDTEFEQMRDHPVMTATIMRPLKRFKEFTEIAAWHHERWDGRGYPDGLAGEEIPLLARIVSIADSWDAMTGDRVYRTGMSVEKSLKIMEDEIDSGQWDPILIRAFVELIKSEQDVPQHLL